MRAWHGITGPNGERLLQGHISCGYSRCKAYRMDLPITRPSDDRPLSGSVNYSEIVKEQDRISLEYDRKLNALPPPDGWIQISYRNEYNDPFVRDFCGWHHLELFTKDKQKPPKQQEPY